MVDVIQSLVIQHDTTDLSVGAKNDFEKEGTGRDCGEFILNRQLVAVRIHLCGEPADFGFDFYEVFAVARNVKLKVVLRGLHNS